MHASPRVLFALLALALPVALVPGCTAPPIPVRGGNILVIVLDDVGTDKLRLYSDLTGLPATPHIDALADRGVVFEQAFAPPVCSPSRAAMLTGRHPRRFGLGSLLRARRDTFELPLAETTIPEMLAASPHAYRSVAVGKWHLSTHQSANAAQHPIASGFEHFAGSLANLAATTPPGDYYRWEKNIDGAISWSDTYATTDTTNEALARIASTGDQPWFLWLAYNGAHEPLHAPPAELIHGAATATRRERFDAMIVALDTEIGRLLDGIAPEALAETNIILVGDNGTPAGLGDAAGKGSLRDSGIHVPLIVAGPNIHRPGSRSTALVHAVDFFATVADLAGVDLNGLRGEGGEPLVIDGTSLLPYLLDPQAPNRRAVVYQDLFSPNGKGPYTRNEVMVRDARYKLVVTSAGEPRFYDIDGRLQDGPDLLSRGELGPDQRQAYAALRERLEGMSEALAAGRPADAEFLSPR